MIISEHLCRLPADIAGRPKTHGANHDVAAIEPIKGYLAIAALPDPGHRQLLLHTPPGDIHLVFVLLAAERDVGDLAQPAGFPATHWVEALHHLVLHVVHDGVVGAEGAAHQFLQFSRVIT